MVLKVIRFITTNVVVPAWEFEEIVRQYSQLTEEEKNVYQQPLGDRAQTMDPKQQERLAKACLRKILKGVCETINVLTTA